MVALPRLALGLVLGLTCGAVGLGSLPARAQANTECVAAPVLSPVLAAPPEFNCVEAPVVPQPVITEPSLCDFFGLCSETPASVP